MAGNMDSSHTPPTLNAPLIGWGDAVALCQSGYTAVYPEIVPGNPLNAPHVARWALNRPGLIGGDEVFAESELVFTYSDIYTPYIKNKIVGKLFMPTIDESIFYSDDRDFSTRSLVCYYVGKSEWKDGFVNRDEAFEITRFSPAKRELGKLFRAARLLCCFDNTTVLVHEAVLCGCPVMVIPDGTIQKDFVDRAELSLEGVAWGAEELDIAKFDPSKVRERYEGTKREYAVQLDHFIAATQQAVVQKTGDIAATGKKTA
jgi:O-antigen biosynthesis protein